MHTEPMAEPGANPLRGGGSGFRAVGGASLRTPGWAPPPARLPFPSAASFQPCSPRRRGLWCSGGGGSRSYRSSLPSFPPRQIPEFARHGFTHCGRPALRS